MANLKHKPVPHDHRKFLERASRRKEFTDAYEALKLDYQLASQRLRAREITLQVKRVPQN